MRFRRAFLGVVLCCAAPNAALAQVREIEAGYEITFAGFTGFRIDFTAKFSGNSYEVESRTFKEGVLKAITIHYEGRNKAWGSFAPGSAQPNAGSLSLAVGGQTRTWLAQYAAGSLVTETHNPPWKPTPEQTIPDAQRLASLDPLSAAIAVGAAGDSACDRTVPSNDGKRRIDIILKKVGSEPAATAGVPQAKGDLLICDIYTKRIAGEFFDAPKEAETERERPMRIWLGRMDDTPFRYPVKLEASTGFGTIRGRLLNFRETMK